MKALFTGGHITPALAVADELFERYACNIVFVGRKFVLTGDKSNSFEYNEVIQKKYPFIHITTGKLSRVSLFDAFFSLLKLPVGFVQAFSILSKEKPDVIVSFGGYISVPIVVVAFLKKIPVFIHEQTLIPGLATKICARFSNTIFIAFDEAKKYFDPKKTHVVGNPLRKELQKTKNSSKIDAHGKKILYITGGSQGAHAINIHIEKILSVLLKKYYIIHQCGNSQLYDDFSSLSKIKNSNYQLQKHFSSHEVANILQSADVVVSRSGANTVWELIEFEIPSILIPLPHSAAGEQQAHAQFMQNKGVSVLFDEHESSSELLVSINAIVEHIRDYRDHFAVLKKQIQSNAAVKMADYIVSKLA